MPKTTVETKWFTFQQNNSGGSFDERLGEFVVVEATDPEHAMARAKKVGLYFDGVALGLDCACCGDRWHDWIGKGSEAPLVYDGPAEEYRSYWMDNPVMIVPLVGETYRCGKKAE